MPKLIAVQIGKNLNPAEAIFVFKEHPGRPMRWWHGSVWEDLDLPIDVFKREYGGFRPFELELPRDWEEGRIVVVNGKATFEYEE